MTSNTSGAAVPVSSVTIGGPAIAAQLQSIAATPTSLFSVFPITRQS
jgi:hypothetical protein